MNWSKIGTILGILATLGAGSVAMISYLNTLATKEETQKSERILRKDMNMVFVDLRINDVESSMRPYEDRGLDTLNAREIRRYDRLQNKLDDFEKTRNELLDLEPD